MCRGLSKRFAEPEKAWEEISKMECVPKERPWKWLRLLLTAFHSLLWNVGVCWVLTFCWTCIQVSDSLRCPGSHLSAQQDGDEVMKVRSMRTEAAEAWDHGCRRSKTDSKTTGAALKKLATCSVWPKVEVYWGVLFCCWSFNHFLSIFWVPMPGAI